MQVSEDDAGFSRLSHALLLSCDWLLVQVSEDDAGFSRLSHTVVHAVELDGADLALHGKNLSCTATTPQHHPRTTSVVIEVQRTCC